MNEGGKQLRRPDRAIFFNLVLGKSRLRPERLKYLTFQFHRRNLAIFASLLRLNSSTENSVLNRSTRSKLSPTSSCAGTLYRPAYLKFTNPMFLFNLYILSPVALTRIASLGFWFLFSLLILALVFYVFSDSFAFVYELFSLDINADE